LVAQLRKERLNPFPGAANDAGLRPVIVLVGPHGRFHLNPPGGKQIQLEFLAQVALVPIDNAVSVFGFDILQVVEIRGIRRTEIQ